MIQSGIITRASTDTGHEYLNPDDSLLYQLFLHLEDRAIGQLTLAVHVPSQQVSAPMLTLVRQGDSSYLIEERDSRGETHEEVVGNMALAHDTASRWVRSQASRGGGGQQPLPT